MEYDVMDQDYGDFVDEEMLQQMYEEDPNSAQEFLEQLMLGEKSQNSEFGNWLTQTFRMCILPSLTAVVQQTSFLFLMCFAINFSKYILLLQSKENVRQSPENESREEEDRHEKEKLEKESQTAENYAHLFVGLFGVILVCKMFWPSIIFCLLLSLFVYGIFLWLERFSNRHHGWIVSGICFSYLVACEFTSTEAEQWHAIRGIQMILCMKLISLAFDIQQTTITGIPNILEYFGYSFCVGTVMFGPWISYEHYQGMLKIKQPIFSKEWLLECLTCYGKAMMCLIVSNCLVGVFISDDSHKWLVAYRDAQSFRFSHYFISYLSESSMKLNGFGGKPEEDGAIKWNTSHICRLMYIEVPRSLVEVVFNWNIPMSLWLNNYIFRKLLPKFGKLAAILFTYAVSSLLHGLNFQLAAVLLSLGFYTYVEFLARKRLARAIDACVGARACRQPCRHCHKDGECLWVALINWFLTGIAMFHLAYLGLMFDSSEYASKGYSMSHTLSKWRHLDFASHWLALLTAVFYALVVVFDSVRLKFRAIKLHSE